ncbi:MAG: DUF4307 domain-containing protein [Actinobacteria bacterium]|uniref:DUF4307 domain-containing protein n=1 Tax=Nostocoides veronense TaxID=330836 RepID=A0ABN2LR31_9MICO|nr:DUF4307 domain-containing protein [Actinomycetota bacterium]
MTFTDPASYDEDELDAPSRPANSRRWWVIGSIGCAAMLAVVAWFGVSATHGRVSWQTRGYVVQDPSAVSVTFDVHRPAGLAVSCRLKAMDARFGTVGSLDVPIPAGPQRSLTLTHEVRTTALAVTGTVERCTPA